MSEKAHYDADRDETIYADDIDTEEGSGAAPCSADEVFPLPWSYDCPRGKEATVYDANSGMVCFIRGDDAQTRAAVIVEAVNNYWQNDQVHSPE